MIKSMTGFGSYTVEMPKAFVVIEVKTLNSKFLDIFCRIPKIYSDREIEIRNLLTQRLERGKVECSITATPKVTGPDVTFLNRPLVKAYFRNLEETAVDLGIQPGKTELFLAALQMPNVLNPDLQGEEEIKEREWALLREGLGNTLDSLEEFRFQEGQTTALKFREYISQISGLLENIQQMDADRIPAVREKLEKAVKELVAAENIDQNRFEQELVFYAERYDISEEKTRLKNHLDYFLETLDEPVSNGKKLNFISQEIGREINTIGSKANDSGIQRLVVQMKDELEKIKEQTLNIV